LDGIPDEHGEFSLSQGLSKTASCCALTTSEIDREFYTLSRKFLFPPNLFRFLSISFSAYTRAPVDAFGLLGIL
jgi:hypothetical protein